ncbi:MAG TPA: glycosyltransferase family 2 protein, partial [Patescibacteria group bacterium]|nr:glycosyltransferase family 2 protein [Patescibacteria group bacterium]
MLTAVVLARNEAQILPRSLKSLKFCDAILVIDDNSTDNTIQVAQKYKVKVVSHALAGNFASQRNFALSQIKSGWALFVDADEVVTPNLAEEISKELKNPLFHAYFLKREDVMW